MSTPSGTYPRRWKLTGASTTAAQHERSTQAEEASKPVPATPTTSNHPVTRASLRARDASDTPTPSTRRTVRRARTNSKHPNAPKGPPASDSSNGVDLGQAHSDQHTTGTPLLQTEDGPGDECPTFFADDGPTDQHVHIGLGRVLSFGAELSPPVPAPALVPNLGRALGFNAQPACSTPRLFTSMAAAANQPVASVANVPRTSVAGVAINVAAAAEEEEEKQAPGGAAGVAEAGAAAGVAGAAANVETGAAVGSSPTLLELKVAELSLEDADAFASPGAIPWPYGSPLGNLNFDVMLLSPYGDAWSPMRGLEGDGVLGPPPPCALGLPVAAPPEHGGGTPSALFAGWRGGGGGGGGSSSCSGRDSGSASDGSIKVMAVACDGPQTAAAPSGGPLAGTSPSGALLSVAAGDLVRALQGREQQPTPNTPREEEQQTEQGPELRVYLAPRDARALVAQGVLGPEALVSVSGPELLRALAAA